MYEVHLLADKSAVEALIVQFYQWEECARLAERRTNAILDGEKDTDGGVVQHKSNEEFIEETVAKRTQMYNLRFAYNSCLISSITKSRYTHGVHIPGVIHGDAVRFPHYGQPRIFTDCASFSQASAVY